MSGRRRSDAELLAEAEQNRKRLRERLAVAKDPTLGLDLKAIRWAQNAIRTRGKAMYEGLPMIDDDEWTERYEPVIAGLDDLVRAWVDRLVPP